ncbi:glycoside hydrolase family 3 protein [Bacillus salipaludis]|uniref:beta-N-acetylhexosaminidase n=1 Tax=Bacillus salipaludis TaxID=2547811 RepID=A0AA90TWW4_9BACI|nr:glycoside hydrolase family 3 N-terminal domain-containing protein [Bacillus salipaludis]MDQ6600988.1 glycoside hydrolase family 3 N-terminal domain-containing protein [Bacillus salipaludis]
MMNLKGNPFYLTDEDIDWVNATLSSMTVQEKVGQLFCLHGTFKDKELLKETLDTFKPGGFMFRPDKGETIQDVHRFLQEQSAFPLLLAANLEAGGNGIALDGTAIANPMQAAATGNTEIAYKLGEIAAKEGSAVGCNWSFAPVVDIDKNFRNPITNIRTFGSDVPTIIKMSKAYVQALQENGLAASIKHFPGDGVDERDHHLVTSVNSLSVEEWDRTYGIIYKELIEAGTKTIMPGHIMLPHYSRKLRPDIKEEEIMPATLSKELLQDLLREQLQFNGVIVSDSTMMAGFAMAKNREEAVPLTIEAGCDVFLFNRDIQEDFNFMMKGLENGLLTMERVEEAATRVLALKASLGLHKKEAAAIVPREEELKVLGCQEHKKWASIAADESITLVKDTKQLLPISANLYRRVLLIPVEGINSQLKAEGFYSKSYTESFADKLRTNGFEVVLFDPNQNFGASFTAPTYTMKEQFDLVIYLANLPTVSVKPTLRLQWSPLLAGDLPWFIQEVPTIFISLANPYHLFDIPRVPVMINCYHANENIIHYLYKKLTGESEFKGKSPVDPFCGCWDTRF